MLYSALMSLCLLYHGSYFDSGLSLSLNMCYAVGKMAWDITALVAAAAADVRMNCRM